MTTNGSFPSGSLVNVNVPMDINGLTDENLSGGGTQCVQVDNSGNFTGSGGLCGGGGGTSASTGTLTMFWDGGGTTLTTGTTYYVPIPSSGTIFGMTMTSNASDTISVYVSSATSASYAASGPTGIGKICASACPSITSGYYAHDQMLSGWSTSIAKDGVIGFVLNSATSATQLSIVVSYTKS